jgi:hypothetical protein
MSCRLNIVIIVAKFYNHIFFFFSYFGLIVVIIMSLFNFPSNLSHPTCHHVSPSINFSLLSSLLCSVVLYNTHGAVKFLWSRVFDSSTCVPSWNSVSKNPHGLLWYPHALAALARACFHESHVWDTSLMWGMLRMCLENVSHIATLALDVQFPVCYWSHRSF